ncbi:putative gustatory receptor 92a [Eupeodes corollae]|uniref:putative gustatory receptor 92a n=1 Tax=Eupeodes corollae TaxID=290404 RepID=UPI0024903207|nr:putative gustatory receptor 92a [Eupeodes corollae]
MYYYGHFFGMIFFRIENCGSCVKFCRKSLIYSTTYRIVCLSAHFITIPRFIYELKSFNINIHFTLISIFLSAIIFSFTIILMCLQIFHYKELISLINETIETFMDLSKISGNSAFIGQEFPVLVSVRVLSNLAAVLLTFYNFLTQPYYIALFKGNPSIIVAYSLVFLSWFGVRVILDFLSFGYTIAAGLYSNIGSHMDQFAQQMKEVKMEKLSKFRRMQVLCVLCDRLDKCAEIYSKIFKLIKAFHRIFRFHILLMLFFEVIAIISNIQFMFVTFMSGGEILWMTVVLVFMYSLDYAVFIIMIDLVVQRSRIPQRISWECYFSDIDNRWDRSVSTWTFF